MLIVYTFQIFQTVTFSWVLINITDAMRRPLTLEQSAVKAIIRTIIRNNKLDSHSFIDQLPLPSTIRGQIKNVCGKNIIGDVIDRILSCNVWLEVQGNYYEDNCRAYRVALENILDELLPIILRQNGFV